MAQKDKSVRDPWREMSRRNETDQVEINEVFIRFSLEDSNAKALKKALIARVTELARDR
jgi:hypothetical protein